MSVIIVHDLYFCFLKSTCLGLYIFVQNGSIVEIVKIIFTLNSFRELANRSNLDNMRSLNLFFFLYYCSIFKNVRLFTRKKTKRVLVILKSPFHYKLPKHHVSYEFWTHSARFLVPLKFSKLIHELLKKGLINDKPHSTAVSYVKKLKLSV